MVLISSLRLRKIVSFKYSFATLSLRAIYHSGRVSRTSAKVSPLGSRRLPAPLSHLSILSAEIWTTLGSWHDFANRLSLSLWKILWKTNAILKEKFVFDLYSLCDKITKLTNNSLDRSLCIRTYVTESESPRRIIAQCIYNARGETADLLGTFWRYLSRGRLREIRAG